MTAPASSRSSGGFTISCGLLNISASVYGAIDSKAAKVNRSEWLPNGHKVGRASIDKETGEVVTDTSQVIKKVAIGDDLVPVDDDEIQAVTEPVKGVANVEAFIPLDDLHQYRVEQTSFVRPKKDDAAAAKAFGLLTQAMADEGVFALVNLALRGPARWCGITPDGELLRFHFDEQVREAPAPVEADVSEAELDLARQLINANRADELPVLTDEATPKVLAYANAKLAGDITEPVQAETPEPAGDLMAALQASVEAVSA